MICPDLRWNGRNPHPHRLCRLEELLFHRACLERIALPGVGRLCQG
jgi:hypothetical protein